jgi:uncharacterized protein (DUF58 family)
MTKSHSSLVIGKVTPGSEPERASGAVGAPVKAPRVALRPGPGLLLLGAGLAGAAVLCFVLPVAAWLVPVGLLAAALLAVADYVALRGAWAHLSVRRELPLRVGRGAAFLSVLRIANAGPRGIRGELRDLLPIAAEPDYWIVPLGLAGGEDREISVQLTIPVRGRHEFGPVWVRLRGPLAMLEGQRSFECPGAVKVVPDMAVSDEALRKTVQAEPRLLDQLTRSRLRGEGTEFESLDEYREGDDPRRIDWRTTARLRRPVVRRYQIEQHRDVMVLVDSGRLMGADAGRGTKLDCAVDSTLMLSRVALKKGDHCGVAVFDDQVRGYLPPQLGPGAYHLIMDSVYNAQSRWQEANFAAMFAALQARQIKRALMVVISDIADADTSVQFRRALTMLAARHVVLFAALQTPVAGEMARAPVETMLDVCRKGVILRLLREREKALHELRRAGVFVLDVEPRELTVPLLNRYVELRERNLL